LLASFWVLAHEPQQSIVMMHMVTARAYDWTISMARPRLELEDVTTP